MKASNWIRPAGKHARKGPAARPAEAARADSPRRPAREVAMLALVVAGLGTAGTTTGHTLVDQGSSGSAAGRNAIGTSTIQASAVHASTLHAVANPWAL